MSKLESSLANRRQFMQFIGGGALPKGLESRLLISWNDIINKKGDRFGFNNDYIAILSLSKVVKNKVAPPFRDTEFDIMYGTGISQEGDILDMAVTHKVVEKAGAWYSYNNEKIGQGRENAKSFLRENSNLLKEIREKVLVIHGLSEVVEEVNEKTGEILETHQTVRKSKKKLQ